MTTTAHGSLPATPQEQGHTKGCHSCHRTQGLGEALEYAFGGLRVNGTFTGLLQVGNGASLSGSLSRRSQFYFFKKCILTSIPYFSLLSYRGHDTIRYIRIPILRKVNTSTSSWLTANPLSAQGPPNSSLLLMRQFTTNLLKLSKDIKSLVTRVHVKTRRHKKVKSEYIKYYFFLPLDDH